MIRAGLLFVLLVHGGFLSSAQDDLAPELREILKQSDIPSLVAVAIVDGEVRGMGAVGLRRQGGAESVTIEDRYHIGSCTKSMTATLAACLIEEGEIEWNATVGKVLKRLEPGNLFAKATLEQLLSNRGGLPKKVPRPIWKEAWSNYRSDDPKQRENFVSAMLREEPVYVPGEGKEYSNAGFTVAGAMLEEVTGKSWEQLMEERIFGPLQMESAGFGAPDREGKGDHPTGHRPNGSPVPSGPGDDNPSAIGPAGTVHCSLPDMAKYVQMHLLSKTGPVLKEESSFEKLHTPMDADHGYAKGWVVLERPWAKGPVLNHNGSNTMFYFVIWMAPDRKFAALSATNIGIEKGAGPCDRAVGALIRKYLE